MKRVSDYFSNLSPQTKRNESPYKKSKKELFSPFTKNTISNNLKSKRFIDTVHKHITLDPLCIKIIDTVEYQRLHSLKQLGTCDFVFRGATHTRFEHSLGVCHLAGRLVNVLRTNQPHLDINDADVLSVKIAGLCHDLGHGPFSHVFDGVFLRRMYPSHSEDHIDGWRHEDGSVQMLKYILKTNNININEYGLNDIDLLFIEEIISGTKEENRKGREPNKFFLYDIVNNSRSGLDVDKLDYFQRDAKMACVAGNPPDFDRFIELARVLPSEPIKSSPSISSSSSTSSLSLSSSSSSSIEYPLMICYPEKMVREAVALFATRFHMHQQVYTHQAVKEIEFMLTDALELADPYITIEGSITDRFPTGRYHISEAIYDMKALSNLNDSILELILASTDIKLQPAKDLLYRIKRRQLYKCVGKTSYNRESTLHQMTEEEILEEILQQNLIITHESNNNILQTGSTNNGSNGYYSTNNLLQTFTEENENDSDNDNDNDSEFNLNDNNNFTILNHDTPEKRLNCLNDKSEQSNNDFIKLNKNDLIVEKMHIHYGMKSLNPVANLRFYPKNSILTLNSNESNSNSSNGNSNNGIFNFGLNNQTNSLTIAKQVDERVYETLLPRSFEDRSIRLFCRTIEKEFAAIHAFEKWCKMKDSHLPFPSLSQQE